MIKGIAQSGKYVTVSGGYPAAPSIPYNNFGSHNTNNGQTFAGQVRYNSSNQSLEIFDGTMWMQYNTTFPSVGLTAEAEELLDWAKQKKAEEDELVELCKEYPSLDAARRQLEMIKIFVKSEEIKVPE